MTTNPVYVGARDTLQSDTVEGAVMTANPLYVGARDTLQCEDAMPAANGATLPSETTMLTANPTYVSASDTQESGTVNGALSVNPTYIGADDSGDGARTFDGGLTDNPLYLGAVAANDSGDGDVAAMVRPGYVYATSIADVPSCSAAAAQVHRTDNDGHSRRSREGRAEGVYYAPLANSSC